MKDGKLTVWHDDSYESCFGSYPEPTRFLRNIDMNELMEALDTKGTGKLDIALSRLPGKGKDDIERLKAFCDENNIQYEYMVKD